MGNASVAGFALLALALTGALCAADAQAPPGSATGQEASPLAPAQDGLAQDGLALAGANGAPSANAATAYQVVRLGDSQLTCAQLLTEINALSADAAAAMQFDYAAMMPQSGALGPGIGMSGLGLLSGLDPTGLSGMVAGQAMAAKARSDADKQMKDIERQMADVQARMAEGQQKQQRVQHLQTLFQQKQC